MVNLAEKLLAYKTLLLDPNNYRFQDSTDFVWADETRFHEKTVPDRAYRRLRDDGLLQLKNSILTNGLLPVERLVARPYPPNPDLNVVIEGNRRLASIRWITEDDEAGVQVPESLLAMYDELPVLVVQDIQDDPVFLEALWGVRHVSGIKEWGEYQRSKLVASLRDERNLESTDVSGRLGMTVHEVNRRYRAFKALQQMQEDEDYGSMLTRKCTPSIPRSSVIARS